MGDPVREQRVRRDDGTWAVHREKPSRVLGSVRLGHTDEWGQHWSTRLYYGTVRRCDAGFPLGGGPWAVIGISAVTDDAVHDWRDFQQIKNALVGEEWEAVELYPAESRLSDTSNRFFLWCAPKGVFAFGLEGRKVLDMEDADAPQRPFPRP